MNTNNAILFTFLIIIIAQALIMPIIADAFNQDFQDYDVDKLQDDALQTDVGDVTNFAFIKFLLGVLFWTVSAPTWLNLIIFTPMRLIMAVILYDKFRGI